LGSWYRDFEYDAERDRGLDFHEDLFNPFTLRFDLSRRAEASIVASTESGRSASRVAEYRQAEINRRRAVGARTPVHNEHVRTLVAAADQYLVARGREATVIAGYHWFGDWGRDTMIALPGLTLLTRGADVARSILLASAQHIDQGMLPNRFPDRGEAPEYNTVDATLWYFEAVRALIDQSTDQAKDLTFVRDRLYPTLVDILDWHLRGTRYGIRVDSDGLVRAGEPGVQLTWMDARVGDWVVTPRHGKPVEIQALWYNALRIMERLAREFVDPEQEKRCRAMALEARESFRHRFWNEATGCLHDVVDAPEGADGVDSEGCDPSIRPNQIFAVSLAHPLLEGERARQVVETVERHLLTPYGLRSLAPEDPRYVGRYEGDPQRRDGAYHQGTVWAWLIGPFIRASMRVHGKDATRKRAEIWLAGLRAHLTDAGLGHISEIFDGDPPHRPAGCIAQAWSVAELLRTMVSDLNEVQPAEARAADLAGLRSGPT
jgi:predicted glycogen debranching enzyme